MNDDPFERAVTRVEAAQEHEDAEHRARRRARWASGQRQAFRIHATAYVAVQVMLVVIWATTGAGAPWFLYPLLGWGVGLAAHYATVHEHFRRT